VKIRVAYAPRTTSLLSKVYDEFQGLRVTPNVYTTLREIDIFAEAMEKMIQNKV
jgi:selenocysteine lyase/cysteine desulfurase